MGQFTGISARETLHRCQFVSGPLGPGPRLSLWQTRVPRFMKNLLITLAAAGCVIGLWLLLAPNGNVHPGVLPPEIVGARPRENSPLAEAPEDVVRSHAPNAESGRVISAGDLGGAMRGRGVVGAALEKILLLTRGQDQRTMSRDFAAEYHSILVAWRADPSRVDEDVAVILRAFEEVPDPAFRWALSWFFESSHDDRFVDALVTIARVDPQRGLHALGNLGTADAHRRIRALLPLLETTADRVLALARIASSGMEGSAELIGRWVRDRDKAPLERLAAVESLGVIKSEPDALRSIMDVAFGDAIPVGDLGERAVDHEVADLRSGAVLALMKYGDHVALQQALARADERGADPAFTAMVDLHLRAWQGGDITQTLMERATRRRRVSYGEALWFLHNAAAADVARLKEFLPRAADARTREILEVAITTASARQ